MDNEYSVKILSISPVTHDVNRYTVEKPTGFTFQPGEATELAIKKEGWEKEKRPFTFTCLPEDAYLEFTIKTYPDHNGVTDQLRRLQNGDELIIGDPWGTISYKSEGVFLAGGAGVTPFIAILRDLDQQQKIGNNRLFFSNRTEEDIILRDEFEKMLGKNFINIVTDSRESKFYREKIDREFLETHIANFDQPFYVCGPEPFQDAMMDALKELGADPEGLVFEK